jgi:hypothetical protein
VVKSENDKREYRLITLPNGLECMLISEKKEYESKNKDKPSGGEEKGKENDDKLWPAACSLSVRVGSYSDPDEVPGLAHFLEHMLFMGNGSYFEIVVDVLLRACLEHACAWTARQLALFVDRFLL